MIQKKLISIFIVLVFCVPLQKLFSQESPTIVNRSTTIQVVDGKEYFFHAVLQGQTLFSIARAYGVTVDDIIKANPELQNEELRFDQLIRIPVKQEPEEGRVQSKAVEQVYYTEHQVRRRETVYGISRQYNITEAQLLEHNPKVRTGLRTNMVLRIPQFRDNRVYYFTYTVPPRQTLFSLSREFDVSIQELEKLNPELKDGLKAGQTIRIPAEPAQQQMPPFIIDEDEEHEPMARPIVTDPYCDDPDLKDYYNVALLIPLFLENMDTIGDLSDHQKQQSFAFLEYYQGITIALDSVRARGADIRLTVLDVCESEAKARSVVWNNELRDMDLIIGPFYPNVFPTIANYAKTQNIPIVSPLFSNRPEFLERYPNMFQITPDISVQMEDMAKYIVQNYPEDNVIVVHSGQESTRELVYSYKNSLNEAINEYKFSRDSINLARLNGYFFNGVYVGERMTNVYVLNDSLLNLQQQEGAIFASELNPYRGQNNLQEVIYPAHGMDTIKHAMDSARHNVIVSLLGGEAVVPNYIRQLNQVRDTFDITIFGVPQWQSYRAIDYNHLQNLSVHIFNHEFIDYDAEHNIDFIRRYRNYNQVEPGFEGFGAVQTGMYFFTALMQYGSNFYRCMDVINQTKSRHTPFWFSRNNENNGWHNNFVYIFRYENYQIKDVRKPTEEDISQR